MEDKFLTCQNCVRWGLPWKLQHKLVLCNERKDPKGIMYHPLHEACKYFIPKSQLPTDLQQLRLFIQTLSPTQLSYVTYATEQAKLVLNLPDSEGATLALGDLVFFTREDRLHYGTVEGLEPSNSKNLCLWSPAFPNESVLIKHSEVKKASLLDMGSIFNQPDRFPNPNILKEIATLRSHKQLTEEQRQDLLQKENQYANIYAEDKYLSAIKDFRRK